METKEEKEGMTSAADNIVRKTDAGRYNLLTLSAELIKEVMDTDRKIIEEMKKELVLLEDSHLHIHAKEGKHSFGCRVNYTDREIGITKDKIRIHKLARRAHLEEMLAFTENRYRTLKKKSDAIDNAEYTRRAMARIDRYHEAGLDLCQVLFTEEQNEWINAAYTPNPYNRENLIYPTGGGLMMRSNSEAKIGTEFEGIGWPYRYDDLVRIETAGHVGRPFRDSYFADFKFPNLLGGITVHEHLGAFHIENYSANALTRLNDYLTFTVYELPGRPVKSEEFTWSLESDLHDPARFRKLISRILLPAYF